MKKEIFCGRIFSIVIRMLIFFMITSCSKYSNIQNATIIDRLPVIDPDYSETVIPPNITPLNFVIKEEGTQYHVKISSKEGSPIEILSTDNKIIIPINHWKELLEKNRGQQIYFDIYVRSSTEEWKQFKTIKNTISNENIDSYLAYRILHPASNYWGTMGIYQRDLESFKEKPILLNRLTDDNCMNCHNFCNNDPNTMLFHMRSGPAAGTMIIREGRVTKVNTSTEFNKAGAYPAWHPSGELIVFSVNQLTMFFHSTGESRDVLDSGSDLIVYKIDDNIVTTHPLISSVERMETFPAWSPDGKYLYFCSVPDIEDYYIQTGNAENLLYGQIKYDLMRIPYHEEEETWGELEMVLSADETGLSATIPRISPDGRFLMVCMSAYSNFPIYLESSDLYLVDLKTMKYHRLDINSSTTESYHSWSSNSRWFVFSSKRRDGLCARPYLSYFDAEGKAHKPILLPQKDPEFYDTFIMTYNVPELIKGEVKTSSRKIVEVAFDQEKRLDAILDPQVQSREMDDSEYIEYQSAPAR